MPPQLDWTLVWSFLWDTTNNTLSRLCLYIVSHSQQCNTSTLSTSRLLSIKLLQLDEIKRSLSDISPQTFYCLDHVSDCTGGRLNVISAGPEEYTRAFSYSGTVDNIIRAETGQTNRN